ncbi:aminotransferase class I/II-fold pyridoxal phosphate-dependent enzyme [Pseudonocardia sichuanensis]
MPGPPPFAITGRGAGDIADAIEAGIVDGALPAGHPLPTVRNLAAELGTSTATVAAAYRRLGERGLVRGNGRAGTVVRPRRPRSARRVALALPPDVVDLSSGNPDPALLPDLRPALAAAADALNGTDGRSALYGHGGNAAELVSALRRRLDADHAPPGEPLVVGGSLDGIGRALATSTRPGDRVLVEDPAYCGLLDLLDALDLRPHPVAADDQGARADAVAESLTVRPAAAVFSPRGHNPTGAARTAERRDELAAVLSAAPGLLVIDDDHLGPGADRPLHPLAGTTTRWAYVYGTSKSLGPDLRLAALLADPITRHRVLGHQQASAGWVSLLLQHAVHALLVDPATDALLDRARETYRARRDALLDALRRRGHSASATSGYNVWLPVPHEATTSQALQNEGWAVRPGEAFRLVSPPAVRITTATLATTQADLLADAVDRAIAGTGRGRSA